jgi:hypothetical protein
VQWLRRHEGVFDHVNAPHVIDKCQINPHVCQLAFRLGRQKFCPCPVNPIHLAMGQMGRGARMAAAFLNLNEDHTITVLGDEIDFAARSAPAFCKNRLSTVRVSTGNNIFGCKACMIRRASAVLFNSHSSSFRLSAN